MANASRLVSVGRINNLTGEVQKLGVKSHWELRLQLGDADPVKNYDRHIEGFVDDTGRFLTRREAVAVGIAAGQLTPDWETVRRELLSSDIDWEAGFKQPVTYTKHDEIIAESRQVRRSRERKG